jgi:hypothetical protein
VLAGRCEVRSQVRGPVQASGVSLPQRKAEQAGGFAAKALCLPSAHGRSCRRQAHRTPACRLHARPERHSLFQSDGTYKPNGNSAADTYIAVDGKKASNDSLVDWRTSTRPTAHPFDAVGGLTLPVGRHTVALIAEPASWLPLCLNDDCRPSGQPASGGSFLVAAGANLSVLVHPATRVESQVLGADAGPFDFKTAGLLTSDNKLTGPLPFVPLLSSDVPPGARAVGLASGWVYEAGNGSDAMLSCLVDGRFPGNAVASWTNQDLWHGAEPRGSLSSQAFLAPTARVRTLSLATVEFPWAPTWGNGGENPTVYSVAARTG